MGERVSDNAAGDLRLEGLLERLRRAESSLRSARESHEYLSHLLENADAIISSYAEERSSARDAEAKAVAELDELDAELAPLLGELQRRDADRAEELAPLKRELSSVEDRLASLEARRQSASASVKGVRGELDRVRLGLGDGDADALQERVANLEDELRAIEEEASPLRLREEGLRRDISEVDARHACDCAGISSRIETLQKRRLGLERELEEKRDLISRCSTVISEAESVRDHPDFVEGAGRRVDELEARVHELGSEVGACRAEAEEREREARRRKLRRMLPLLAVAAVALVIVAAALCRAAWVGDRVVIDEWNFPDDGVRSAAKMEDADGDGMLSPEEIDSCEIVILTKAENLAGLERFSNLRRLDVDFSPGVTDASLSAYAGLEEVLVSLSSKASLDLSGLDKLEELYLGKGEGFDVVNLSGCSSLTDLDVSTSVDEFVVDADTSRAVVRSLRSWSERLGCTITEL